MRREFAPILYDIMAKDKDVVLVSADLGYGMWDKVRARFNGTQFHSIGASEFTGLGMTCGLALGGKKAIFFSITPFALMRPAEIIRLYMNHDQIPAKILGGGRDWDYKEQGFTHCMPEDRQFMSLFPNVKCYWPESVADLPAVTNEWLYNGKPSYLNLKR